MISETTKENVHQLEDWKNDLESSYIPLGNTTLIKITGQGDQQLTNIIGPTEGQ